MIIDYDIRLLQRFLHLSKVFGTNRIIIKPGDDINTWVITLLPPARK